MTSIRPEISKKKPYWISRHRYYELKHYCLQYHEWQYLYLACDGVMAAGLGSPGPKEYKDPVGKSVIVRDRYLRDMKLVEDAAEMTDPVIGRYIFLAVTEGRSYENLRTTLEIPCCKDVYYELYRKFFYILSQKKHTLI